MYNRFMFQVTKEIHFATATLMNYDGKCRYFPRAQRQSGSGFEFRHFRRPGHGARFYAEIKENPANLDRSTLDHRMLLHQNDPLLNTLKKAGEPIYAMGANPTAENYAKLIYDTARAKGLAVSSVRLWETPNSFATSVRNRQKRHVGKPKNPKSAIKGRVTHLLQEIRRDHRP